MSAIACILLCASAHLVRDGQPSFKVMLAGLVGTRWEFLYHLSTQLARASGAALCLTGALIVQQPHLALLLGAAIWIGFYTDMKHGEGQGAATWEDAGWLTLSGFTSLVPLALVVAIFVAPIDSIFIAAGLFKAPIWFAWSHSRVQQNGPWFEPTRFSAISFGSLVGALVVFA